MAFYEFPNNTFGGAAVPILPIPTPLAAITTNVGGANLAVSLRATIGWMAQSIGVNTTSVLFKIWRGAPVTGALVVSVLDSGESVYDNNKVTTFAGVDFNFSGAQTVTYVLTAELPNPGTAARVVGGLTFTTKEFDTGPNRTFYFSTLPNNTVGSILIPIATTPAPLTSVFTSVQANDTVFIRATIGWTALSGVPNVLFKIWRGAPFTGKLVVSTIDSGEGAFDRNKVTSFDGVDTGFTTAQDAVYFLTAEITNAGTAAQVVGALTMTASRFAAGDATATYYTLPNNTADSVVIPITATPQPIAFLNLPVAVNAQITLRGTVGWRSGGSKTDVLFKLWRGAPLTGQLIYSVDDSGDVDRTNVTEFAHVDTEFTTAQSVTYVLTAELTSPNLTANVIGPLTFTAVES